MFALRELDGTEFNALYAEQDKFGIYMKDVPVDQDTSSRATNVINLIEIVAV